MVSFYHGSMTGRWSMVNCFLWVSTYPKETCTVVWRKPLPFSENSETGTPLASRSVVDRKSASDEAQAVQSNHWLAVYVYLYRNDRSKWSIHISILVGLWARILFSTWGWAQIISRNQTSPGSSKALHAHPPLHQRPLALPQGSILPLSDSVTTENSLRCSNGKWMKESLEDILIFWNWGFQHNFQPIFRHWDPRSPTAFILFRNHRTLSLRISSWYSRIIASWHGDVNSKNGI